MDWWSQGTAEANPKLEKSIPDQSISVSFTLCPWQEEGALPQISFYTSWRRQKLILAWSLLNQVPPKSKLDYWLVTVERPFREERCCLIQWIHAGVIIELAFLTLGFFSEDTDTSLIAVAHVPPVHINSGPVLCSVPSAGVVLAQGAGV